MSLKFILSSFTALLVLIIIGALWLHLSTWFIWYLIPDGNIKLAVNLTEPTAQVVSGLLAISPLQDELPLPTGPIRRFSFVRSSDFTAIALVPTNPFLFRERHQLQQQLADRHWRVANLGLIIIGVKGQTAINPLSTSIPQTLRKLFSRQYPSRPVVIAVSEPNTIPLLPSSTALIGVAAHREQELRLVLTNDLTNLPNFPVTSPALPVDEDYLSVNLSGTAIQTIINQFGDQWNDVIRARLGFTHTKPHLIDILAAQQTASLTISDTGASIAMTDQPSDVLKATINQWLTDEEAYSRPRKHAFRLPDGTLGYELIKGLPQPVLSDPDETSCQAPLSQEVQLWLCRRDQAVSLATSLTHARQALDQLTPHQIVSVGRRYLRQLNHPASQNINSLILYSSDPYTLLTVKLDR